MTNIRHALTARGSHIRHQPLLAAAAMVINLLLSSLQPAHSAGLREKVATRIAERQAQTSSEDSQLNGDNRFFAITSRGKIALPDNVKRLSDLAYGTGDKQTLDVYLNTSRPANTALAPVIFMVHGGAWRIGDKAMSRVVSNKIERWVTLPRGFIFISVNYPMLPGTDPLKQAESLAKALAYAQQNAAQWGGDARKFILMGHSAGAHLVALLGANPRQAFKHGAKPWLGTVALDSALYNVAATMKAKHYSFYDQAFGSDPAYWQATSPYDQLSREATSFYLVCSTRRSDACPQADAFARRSNPLGIRSQVLQQNLSHSEINENLGLPGGYTDAVETYLAGLDSLVKKLLTDTARR